MDLVDMPRCLERSLILTIIYKALSQQEISSTLFSIDLIHGYYKLKFSTTGTKSSIDQLNSHKFPEENFLSISFPLCIYLSEKNLEVVVSGWRSANTIQIQQTTVPKLQMCTQVQTTSKYFSYLILQGPVKKQIPELGNGTPQGISCLPMPSDRCWFLQSLQPAHHIHYRQYM